MGTDDDALPCVAADAGGGAVDRTRDVLPVHATGVHHTTDDRRLFQTRHAKRPGLPLAASFISRGCGGMVRTNDVDRAICDLTHRPILARRQRGFTL